jgi:N-acetylglucosamine malate deacetylase 1
LSVDVLAIGAHPDDADLGVGGFLRKLADAGKTTAILDLTEGELGSRGTVEERYVEAAEAAECLGVSTRKNAQLPDGSLQNTAEQRLAIVQMIRQLKPRVILGPMKPDRHPDHEAACDLVRDAHFLSGVHGLDTGQAAHRAQGLYGYYAYQEGELVPPLVIDISEAFERKLKALRAFRSQFHNTEYEGPETHVASRAFWDAISTRAAYWGNQIGVRYGEPLYGKMPIAMSLPPELEEMS